MTTKTYTQAEVDQLIATTRRETVEEIERQWGQFSQRMSVRLGELVNVDERTRTVLIKKELKGLLPYLNLDQLPDKQEV